MKPISVDALTNLIDKVVTYRSSPTNDRDDRDVDFDLWSILLALRGPDGGNGKLKDTYTGPIRAWVSKEWNKSVGSSTNSKVLTLSEFLDLNTQLVSEPLDSTGYSGMTPSAFNHYINHIRQALNLIIKVERFKEFKKA